MSQPTPAMLPVRDFPAVSVSSFPHSTKRPTSTRSSRTRWRRFPYLPIRTRSSLSTMGADRTGEIVARPGAWNDRSAGEPRAQPGLRGGADVGIWCFDRRLRHVHGCGSPVRHPRSAPAGAFAGEYDIVAGFRMERSDRCTGECLPRCSMFRCGCCSGSTCETSTAPSSSFAATSARVATDRAGSADQHRDPGQGASPGGKTATGGCASLPTHRR